MLPLVLAEVGNDGIQEHKQSFEVAEQDHWVRVSTCRNQVRLLQRAQLIETMLDHELVLEVVVGLVNDGRNSV